MNADPTDEPGQERPLAAVESQRAIQAGATASPRESVEHIPARADIKDSAHAPAAVRARATFALLWTTIGIIVVLLALIGYDEVTGKDWTRFKDLFPIVLSPFVTLLSTAVGFYFAVLVEKDKG